jgi:ATP-dependent RNA helicase RhlE
MDFKSFGFSEHIVEGISAMGYEEATPVQVQAIPLILEGRDVIGSAQTGTGKTAAFLLPLIELITKNPDRDEKIKALVIVPTRELALQIDQQFQGFAYYSPISSMPIYGGGDGRNYSDEKNALTSGVDVVICTPGRMIAHLLNDYVDLSELRYLILDEADRMLDMGFLGDILRILSYMPKDRQTMMFSATMPDKIRELARKTLRNPAEINIAVSKPADGVIQMAYVVYEEQKIPVITKLLRNKPNYRVVIFCSTKIATKQISRKLSQLGLKVGEIHSDLDQKEREQILLDYRNHKLNILAATDIIARGIDIDDIELVINFHVPSEAEDYIHRIGRTARINTEGVAITFASPDDHHKLGRIEKFLGKEIYKAKVESEFGEVPGYQPHIAPARSFHKKPFFNQRKKGSSSKNQTKKP